MAILTLHRKQRFKLAIPYWVYINGCPVGLMRSREVSVQMPEGTYTVDVKIMFKVFKWMFGIGGSRKVSLQDEDHVHLAVTDRERWWNLLFDIDLVLWLASFFLTLPQPWDVVYHVLSEGFFVVWLIRIFIIRNRYFILKEIHHQL